MTQPYKAPAIAAIERAVNARWPNRSRASDGWIGDAAHATRPSDHNPLPGIGAVLAYDFTVNGIDPWGLIAALVLDDRVRYIIYDEKIAYVDDGFRVWYKYTGSNPHTKHIHVSVRQARRYWGDGRDFRLGTPAPAPAPAPIPEPPKEDDMSFYVTADTNQGVYLFNQRTGKIERMIPPDEWSALRAMQSGAVPQLPLPLYRVSQHWLKKIKAL